MAKRTIFINRIRWTLSILSHVIWRSVACKGSYSSTTAALRGSNQLIPPCWYSPTYLFKLDLKNYILEPHLKNYIFKPHVWVIFQATFKQTTRVQYRLKVTVCCVICFKLHYWFTLMSHNLLYLDTCLKLPVLQYLSNINDWVTVYNCICKVTSLWYCLIKVLSYL